MFSGDGGRTTPDHDIQDTPETDPIAQGLAALDKRLGIEQKVSCFVYLVCSVHIFTISEHTT